MTRRRLLCAPSSAWTALALAALSADNDGWNGYTLRFVISSALVPKTFTQVRLSFQAGAAEGLDLAGTYIGLKGAGAYDFAATPAQVLFGGSGTLSLAANGTLVSDAVTLSGTTSDSIVVSVYCNSATDTFRISGSNDANYSSAYKFGNDLTTLTASGYSAYIARNFIYSMEVA